MSVPGDIPEETCVLPDISRPNMSAKDTFESEIDGIPTVSYVQSKIIEFSNLFNSSYRLALLNCGPERQNLIYLLISLKKSIKWALEELDKSLNNREYHFSCGLCDEDIPLNTSQDIWSSLQDHEHFEELYYQFINNKLEIRPLPEEVSIPTTSESESNLVTEDATTAGDSNTDSGIEQHEMEPSTSGLQQTNACARQETSYDKNVNNFRFNFNTSYDEEVENKIYPSAMMIGVRKYDKVKEFTIMRTGNCKAACLICHCEMNGMRITKHMLVNHSMGQKHLKAATDPLILEILQFHHEYWLKQELPIQAHQVYFRPIQIAWMKCSLCSVNLLYEEVIPHILSKPHKKRVLEMYEKRTNLYYLVTLQVQAYGITQEQIEARETEYRLQEEAKAKERKPRKNSDSDTAEEAKKVGSKHQEGIAHNIIKSVENPESTDPLDLLPNRMKNDAKFLKRISKASNKVIRCDLCKCNIQDSISDLKNHIITAPPHLALKRDNYKFFCEICDIKVTSENGWMTHNFSGPRHTNMAASRKLNVTEHECTTCKTIIFGDNLSLLRHLSIGNKGNRRERGTRLPDPVKQLFQSKPYILEQCSILAAGAEDVLANSLTQDCCRRLESALSEVFEDCKVFPFGSRISGTGNKDSDLDVFVDIGGMYYGEKNQEPTEQVLILRKANKAFSKNKEYSNIIQVATARTPILKLHHLPTQLDCDLSFKHGLSVENTKFLRFCNELQPACQQLILLIKKWGNFISFESINTYALAILCIFYLQVNGYLLSVEKIRKLNKSGQQTINGWKTIEYVLSINDSKAHVKAYSGSVFELLQEFFKFYGKFDFNTYVICPLLGRVVKRSLFSEGNPEDLPPEMGAYVAQLEREDPEVFRSNSHMCIQDPFDLSHNLTKAAQQGTLTRFQSMCKLSLTHIEALK